MIEESKILKIKKILSTFTSVDNIYFSSEIKFQNNFLEYSTEKTDEYSSAIVNKITEIPKIIKGGAVFILDKIENLDSFIETGFSLIETFEGVSVFCHSGIVDVILPTWNAYEYVVDCVNSIYKHTTNVPFRLILVDDCSPQKEIGTFFKKIKRDQDIYLLNNENVGFVQTCNNGMKLSEINDVVLQNTDTVVTKNWLSNMIVKSYQDPKVGICNPISNNASIYSIKEFEKANIHPDEVAGALIENSRDMVLEVPVAVGFCFFVKREVLNKVGLLDEVFGRGYGEENDMCLKAYLAGYKSIIIDNSFVYHKGSISMVLSGDMKKNHPDEISTKPEHEKILHERYPFFPKLLNDLSFQNNLFNFLATVKFNCFSKLSEKRKKILYLLHSNPFTNVGGTEIHVLDLSRKISETFSVYILFPNFDDYVVYEYFNGAFVNKFIFPKVITIQEYTLHSANLKNVYARILNILNIDILHVHHFKNNTLDCVDAAEEIGIPVFYTMHDYYSVDPNHNLSFKVQDGFYDEEFVPNTEYYEKFTHQLGFDINLWHTGMERMMKKCKMLLAPSRTVKNEIQKVYDIKDIDVKGIPMWITEPENPNPKKLPDDKKRLCFLGGVNAEIKGKYLIEKIVPELIKKGFEFHFLGSTGENWDLPNSKQIIFHGTYERKDVINKLHEINPSFVLILSIVHESFSYTLSESFKAGIPVICTPMGAVAERVKENNFGYILKSCNPEKIIDELELLTKERIKSKVYDKINNQEYFEFISSKYDELTSKIITQLNKSENSNQVFYFLEMSTKVENFTKFNLNSRQFLALRIFNKFEKLILQNRLIKKFIVNNNVKYRLKKRIKLDI